MKNTFMRSPKYFFTSESVTEGHPDKLCDQVADGILDAMIKDDPKSRVACEVAVTIGLVIVLGEITTKTYVEIPDIVRRIVKDIGYTKPDYQFDYQSLATHGFHQEAIAQYQCRRQQGSGSARKGQEGGRARPDRRGRPGHDVRLCLQRDRGAYAAAHLPWRTS